MKTEVEVLFQGANTIVFQSKLRGYPSITLQGDTLSLLFSRAKLVKEYIYDELSNETASEELEEVKEAIDSIYSKFEELRNIYGEYGVKR